MKIRIGAIQLTKKLSSGDISSMISLENCAPEAYSRSVRLGSSIRPVL